MASQAKLDFRISTNVLLYVIKVQFISSVSYKSDIFGHDLTYSILHAI